MEAHAMETEDAHGAQPAGLGIAEDGYTLRMGETQMERGAASELHFAIDGPDGAPMTGFDELHGRRMHLIVVRRDGPSSATCTPRWTRPGPGPCRSGSARPASTAPMPTSRPTENSRRSPPTSSSPAARRDAPLPGAADGRRDRRLRGPARRGRRPSPVRRPLSSSPHPRRSAGRGPAALPRGQGSPGGAARRRPRLPPCPPGGGPRGGSRRDRVRCHLPDPGPLPPLPTVQGRRRVRTAQFTVVVPR